MVSVALSRRFRRISSGALVSCSNLGIEKFPISLLNDVWLWWLHGTRPRVLHRDGATPASIQRNLDELRKLFWNTCIDDRLVVSLINTWLGTWWNPLDAIEHNEMHEKARMRCSSTMTVTSVPRSRRWGVTSLSGNARAAVKFYFHCETWNAARARSSAATEIDQTDSARESKTIAFGGLDSNDKISFRFENKKKKKCCVVRSLMVSCNKFHVRLQWTESNWVQSIKLINFVYYRLTACKTECYD